MPNVDLNITDLSKSNARSYQVRVKITGVEISKTFNWKNYGGKRKALKAAQEYRDKIYEKHNLQKPRITKGNYRRQFNQFKYIKSASTGVVGVSRSRKIDSRRPHLSAIILYSVHWRDFWVAGTKCKAKPKQKTFYCGYEEEVTPAMEVAALNAARDFRAEYEHAIQTGERFAVDVKWKNWREIYGPKLSWMSKSK